MSSHIYHQSFYNHDSMSFQDYDSCDVNRRVEESLGVSGVSGPGSSDNRQSQVSCASRL